MFNYDFKKMLEELKNPEVVEEITEETTVELTEAEKIDLFKTLDTIEIMAKDASKKKDNVVALKILSKIAKMSSDMHKEIKKRLKL